MVPNVAIKSTHDGTTLSLSDFDGDYFFAELRGSQFHGSARVYSHVVSDPSDFFKDLAIAWHGWRGWEGVKSWASLEGEFELSATCDSAGHISLSIQLRSGPYPFDWVLRTVLLLEVGQLDGIASHVARFFAHELAE